MTHAMQIRQTGGPEVLNWTAVDVGEPGLGQVRLRHAAAWLNYIDVYHRNGYYPEPLPFIPGLEGAGTVVAVAQDVPGLKIGDRVAYAGPTGAYCDVRLRYIPTLARLSTATRIDGDVRASLRSHRSHCARSAVAEGLAVSDAPNALPLHRATRCAGSFRERAVRGGGFGKGAH
jgi:NADPH2:quinone reductase